jgi:hypothetical protein
MKNLLSSLLFTQIAFHLPANHTEDATWFVLIFILLFLCLFILCSGRHLEKINILPFSLSPSECAANVAACSKLLTMCLQH